MECGNLRTKKQKKSCPINGMWKSTHFTSMIEKKEALNFKTWSWVLHFFVLHFLFCVALKSRVLHFLILCCNHFSIWCNQWMERCKEKIKCCNQKNRRCVCIILWVLCQTQSLKNGLFKPFLRLFFLSCAALMLGEWVKNPRFGVYLVFMGIGLYRELLRFAAGIRLIFCAICLLFWAMPLSISE